MRTIGPKTNSLDRIRDAVLTDLNVDSDRLLTQWEEADETVTAKPVFTSLWNGDHDGFHGFLKAMANTLYVLESSFEVLVVNSQHFKQVPGHKTDAKNAEWLAELLSNRDAHPVFECGASSAS